MLKTKLKNRKKTKNGQSEPEDKWQKQSYTDKITQEAHTYTLTKREKEKIYIYLYKRRATKSINNSTNDNNL